MSDIYRASVGEKLPGCYVLPMYVFANDDFYFGATVLCYPEEFSSLAQRFQSDLFLFPSSIHEIIAIPALPIFEADTLRNMVRDINGSEVSPNEVLSDSVYRYCLATGKITIIE